MMAYTGKNWSILEYCLENGSNWFVEKLLITIVFVV